MDVSNKISIKFGFIGILWQFLYFFYLWRFIPLPAGFIYGLFFVGILPALALVKEKGKERISIGDAKVGFLTWAISSIGYIGIGFFSEAVLTGKISVLGSILIAVILQSLPLSIFGSVLTIFFLKKDEENKTHKKIGSIFGATSLFLYAFLFAYFKSWTISNELILMVFIGISFLGFLPASFLIKTKNLKKVYFLDAIKVCFLSWSIFIVGISLYVPVFVAIAFTMSFVIGSFLSFLLFRFLSFSKK